MGNMIKIAICDDEQLYRDEIKSMLIEHKDAQYFAVEVFCNGKDLLNSSTNYDFIFLDIELQDSVGLDIAKEIRKTNKDVIIFFITSYTQYISEAFRTVPFQYLIKPIDKVMFNEEVDRAMKHFLAIKNSLSISWNNEEMILSIKNIVYVEHYSRKVKFKMINGDEYFSGGKLNDYEKKLMPYYFVRIHNSFLLNLRYLKHIKTYTAIISNGEELPISKKYIKELRMKFAEKLTGVKI